MTEQDEDVIFLLASGLEFIRSAFDDVKTRPKFSVVHFLTGMELLLKATILGDDWRNLVRTESQGTVTVDYEKFRKGDFSSLSLTEVFQRFSGVTNVEIPQQLQSAGNELAKHRNRIVHFYDAVDTGSSSHERLVELQCRCWFYLEPIVMTTLNVRDVTASDHRRCDIIWQELAAVEAAAREHHQFRTLTRKAFKVVLEGLENQGLLVTCRRCKQRTARIYSKTECDCSSVCLVCRRLEHVRL